MFVDSQVINSKHLSEVLIHCVLTKDAIKLRNFIDSGILHILLQESTFIRGISEIEF